MSTILYFKMTPTNADGTLPIAVVQVGTVNEAPILLGMTSAANENEAELAAWRFVEGLNDEQA